MDFTCDKLFEHVSCTMSVLIFCDLLNYYMTKKPAILLSYANNIDVEGNQP